MSLSKPNESTERVLEPFEEQEPFFGTDKKYYGYVSGVGAGKTFAGILRTALNIQQWNPGEMGAIVAPTRTMVQDVIISEMRDLGLLDHWEYKSTYSSEPGIHAPNGSRALILSADNKKTIERLRGLNLAWWWMDEEAIIDPRAREILMQRLRTGEYRNGYITTTPKGRNHTYDFFVGDHRPDEYSHGEGTIYETDDRLAITGVPSWANPHTPEDYHEAMGDLPDQIRAQEVEGNFVEIGAGIFKKSMLSFAEPSDLPERDMNFIAGVDIGVEGDSMAAQEKDSDFWAITVLLVDSFKSTAYVLDCERDRGLSLAEGIQWISQVVSPFPNNIPIYVESNAAQRWVKDELKNQGLNAIAITNTRDKEERIRQISIPIQRGTVKFINKPPNNVTDKELREWREYYNKHDYAPRWEDMVAELLAFPDGAHDDLVDSLEIAIDKANIGSGTFNVMGSSPKGDDE